MFMFGTPDASNPTMYEMYCTYVDLGHVMFGTFNVSNLTMSQINIGIFGALLGLERRYTKPNHALNMPMLIWNMVGFGITYPKSNHVPNIPMLI